jgi:tetratricopeptide (TPR) repeat protein
MKQLFCILIFFLPYIGSSNDSLDSLSSPRELILQQNYNEALSILESRLKQNPSFADFYNAGIAYEEMGSHRQALWAFASALKINPADQAAQTNASIVYRSLNQDGDWVNQFSWVDRGAIAFQHFWVPLLMISCLFLAIFIFFTVAKKESKRAGMKKFFIPALLLFSLSLLAINRVDNHFAKHKFAILKSKQVQFYLNPEGVPIDQMDQSPLVLSLEKFSSDSTWVSVQVNGQSVWTPAENMLTY